MNNFEQSKKITSVICDEDVRLTKYLSLLWFL